MEDLDSRVADQYSLTDVQIDEVSLCWDCPFATLTPSLFPQLVKISSVVDKEDLPLEKRRLVALDEIRRLQKSCTVHGRVLLRESDLDGDVWWCADHAAAFTENCEALLLLVRLVPIVDLHLC